MTKRDSSFAGPRLGKARVASARRRRRVGRPSKLTADTERTITAALAEGATAKDAAELAGVDEATLYRWLARGAAGERRFAVFAQRVEAAREARVEAQRAEMRRATERWLEEMDRQHEAAITIAMASVLR